MNSTPPPDDSSDPIVNAAIQRAAKRFIRELPAPRDRAPGGEYIYREVRDAFVAGASWQRERLAESAAKLTRENEKKAMVEEIASLKHCYRLLDEHREKERSALRAQVDVLREGLGDIGKGTAALDGFDHCLARAARDALARADELEKG